MKTVIIGAGFTGLQLARELVAEKNEVVLMDSDAARVRNASDQLDCKVVEDDGRNLASLERAGIASADALVALTEDDEVNMITCSLVDAVYPNITKVARVRNYSYYLAADEARSRAKSTRPDARPLYGINAMLNPEVEAASAIASAIEHGAVGNVIELGRDFGIATLSIGDDSPLDGMPLSQMSSFEGWSYLLAFVDSHGELSLPSGDTVLQKGDFIGVVTPKDAIPRLLEFTKTPKADIRRIVLFGADNVGSLLLAKRKARKNPSVWLRILGLAQSAPDVEVIVVDKDSSRCRAIVERFPDVRVLCGDVTDENLLNEEELFSADLLVAASGNYELNLVTAAYMKSRGVKKSVALTANSSYGAIAQKLGVDVAVPMRGSVVDSIMGHLRGRNVMSVHSVCNRRLEIVEGEISANAAVAGKTLAELAKENPGGPLVLLHRAPGADLWSVPGGSTLMAPGSHVALIARSNDKKSESRFFGKA